MCLCFVPQSYQHLDKHFHQLKSWAIYLHVAHRLSGETLEELFKELFHLAVFDTEIYMFRTLLARMYQPTYRKLMEKRTLNFTRRWRKRFDHIGNYSILGVGKAYRRDARPLEYYASIAGPYRNIAHVHVTSAKIAK